MINSIKADVYFRKAQAKSDMGYYEESISLFDKAIALSKNPFGMLMHKAMSLSKLERYEESVDLLTRTAEIRPDNPCNYLFLGIVQFDRRLFDEAVDSFGKVLKMTPDNKIAECFKYLSCLAKKEDDLEALDKFIQNVQYSNAECKTRYLMLCESYLHRRKAVSMSFEERKFFDTYVDPDAESRESLTPGLLDKIEIAMNRLRYCFDPQSKKVYEQFLLSYEYLAGGDFENAQKEIQLILAANPNFEEAIEMLIDICIFKKEIEPAISYLNEVEIFQEAFELLNHDDNCEDVMIKNSSAALILAILLTHDGKYEDAIKLLKHSITDNDKSFYPFYCLGRCYLHVNDRTQAFNCFKSSMNRLTEGFLESRSAEYRRVLTVV